MKNHLTEKLLGKGVAVGIAGAMLFTATFAFAAVTPTVTTTVLNSSNDIVTSAAVGTIVSDSATVASSTATTTPTGTVDFALYPNTSCSGTPTTQSGVSLANGSALSATTSVPGTGLSYLVTYDGDSNYASTTSSCEPVAAIATSTTAMSTTVATTLSTTTAVVGSSVYDSATLSGATANAGGAVTYTIYSDSACTANAASAGIEPVTNGIAVNSGNFQFNTAGTYYWQALYSGDANNAPATSPCGSEVLTVTASSTTGTTTGTTTSSGNGIISGTVYNDLNRDGILDNNEPGLAGWTINLYDNAGWSGPTNRAPFMTTVSGTNGAYSFVNLPDGTYSIEEINQPNGLNQFTSDYKSVVILNGDSAMNENFGNVSGNPYGNGSTTGSQNGQGGSWGNSTSTPGTNNNGNQWNKNPGNQGNDKGKGSFFGDVQSFVKNVSGRGNNHK